MSWRWRTTPDSNLRTEEELLDEEKHTVPHVKVLAEQERVCCWRKREVTAQAEAVAQQEESCSEHELKSKDDLQSISERETELNKDCATRKQGHCYLLLRKQLWFSRACQGQDDYHNMPAIVSFGGTKV